MAEQFTLPGGEGQQAEPVDGKEAGPSEQVPVDDVAAPGTDVPPKRSRRKDIVIAATAFAVLIGGTAVGIALSGGSSGPSFPGTLLGLTRDTSTDALQATGQVTSELGVLQGLIVDPGVAVYGLGPPDQGVAIITGQWSDAAKTDGLISSTPARALDALKSEGVKDATSYPAGPRGGALACGDTSIDGQSIRACLWMTDKMFAVTFYFNVTSSLSDAATKTIQVRSAMTQ